MAWAQARRLPRKAVRAGEAWGRLYDQRWCRVELPAGRGRWLRWEDQGEATLHVDGTPFFGFDVAHRECELPDTARVVWVESWCVQAALWHPEARGLDAAGSRFGGATLLRRNEEAWQAYHDLNCLADYLCNLRLRECPGADPDLNPQVTQAPVDDVSPLFRRLLRALDRALNALDTSGIPALRRSLTRVYDEMRDARPLARAALTGHSHLDLVWLWPERVGEAKAVHTFANVEHLMARYPEFRFAYSQPESYEAVGRRAPALLEAVSRRIQSGQWEATGGMQVESDSHLACGEGLARSLMLGQANFTKLTGSPSRVLWLPDLFGFSACLPQLMTLSGLDFFFTTKTTWNAVHRFPHSSFVWRGPGGRAAVLGHVTQGVQFNNTVSVDQLRAASHQHQQADVHDEFLMPNGWGDGGGGPTADMCERARRLDRLRGLPALQWDQPEAFFDRLAGSRAVLPTHDGEIYLEYHRGTYTTHSRVKALFRGLERALQLREATLVAADAAPPDDVAHAWQRLIFAQFHDWIPGSSIPEVYAEGLPEQEKLIAAMERAARRQLGTSNGRQTCLFNPLPVPLRHVVGGHVHEVPPLSGLPRKVARCGSVIPVVAEGRTLRSDRVMARFDARGRLVKLVVDGRAVGFEGPAGELVLHPDEPCSFGPWDIDRHSLSLGEVVRTPVTLTAAGDTISVSRRVGAHSQATIHYRLVPGEPALRLTVELNWRETDSLLKLRFPTAYRAREVRCGTPFGSVMRPQLATSTQAEMMWEWPMSRWTTISADAEREGLWLVTKDKYGVSCRDGELGLSLVRSPLHVGYEENKIAYPAGLSRLPEPDSRHTDQGAHRIELAIGHYTIEAPRAEQPAVLAETLFAEPVAYRGAAITSPFGGVVGGETLIPSWVQPDRPGRWILRLHEVGGQRGRATVQLAPGWTARKEDLLGRALAQPLRKGQLDFAPYEIISLAIERLDE
jgi:alpha-mannosidase